MTVLDQKMKKTVFHQKRLCSTKLCSAKVWKMTEFHQNLKNDRVPPKFLFLSPCDVLLNVSRTWQSDFITHAPTFLNFFQFCGTQSTPKINPKVQFLSLNIFLNWMPRLWWLGVPDCWKQPSFFLLWSIIGFVTVKVAFWLPYWVLCTSTQ